MRFLISKARQGENIGHIQMGRGPAWGDLITCGLTTVFHLYRTGENACKTILDLSHVSRALLQKKTSFLLLPDQVNRLLFPLPTKFGTKISPAASGPHFWLNSSVLQATDRKHPPISISISISPLSPLTNNYCETVYLFIFILLFTGISSYLYRFG